VTLDRKFYSLLLKQEGIAAQLLPQFVLIAFLEEDFIRKAIILLRINYIICKYNNAIINNICGRFQGLSLRFKVPLGERNNFFEIHRQFGHAPSKRFVSPGIVGSPCDIS
jgi:hypothetical protein